jgi:hypothetical protein
MDILDITDPKSLQAWLETGPRDEAAFIALRCAMRVMPFLFWSARFRASPGFDLRMLRVSRFYLTSLVARRWPTSEDIMGATTKAAGDCASCGSATTFRYGGADAPYAFAAEAAAEAARAVDVVHAAVDAARAAADAIWQAVFHTAYADFDAAGLSATDYLATAAGDAAVRDTYAALRSDCYALLAGDDPLPLWPCTPPDWLTMAKAAMLTYWQTENPAHWSFWHRWWDAATSGHSLDWQLQHDIALIPDDIWQSGPGPVAGAIARIEAVHRAKAAQPPHT